MGKTQPIKMVCRREVEYSLIEKCLYILLELDDGVE